jgi:hypothetical protein
MPDAKEALFAVEIVGLAPLSPQGEGLGVRTLI